MGTIDLKRADVRFDLVAALTALAVVALMLFGSTSDALAGGLSPRETVRISGKAYVFNHMDTGISGATIKVREFPLISVKTDEFGNYWMKVPTDTNVTPYILSGDGLLTKRSFADNSPTGQVQTHWNEVDLQTFHTRRADIENANFQAPADGEYEGLKALLSVPAGADGRPAQCVIVTTASARDVRGVDYHTFWENTPHGVPGATSIEYPAIDGPVYFNERVIPDRTKVETSEDGGIIWPIVPAGTYRIVTSSPATKFASFLATCAPGRIINANPPWGAYELSPGEKPLGASNVAANVTRAKAYRKNKKRFLFLKVKSGEQIDLFVSYSSISKPGVPALVGAAEKRKVPAGTKSIRIRMPWMGARFRIPLKVSVKLKDASGVSFTSKHRVTLPKLKPNRRR